MLPPNFSSLSPQQQVAWFNSLSPEEQQQVAAELQQHQAPGSAQPAMPAQMNPTAGLGQIAGAGLGSGLGQAAGSSLFGTSPTGVAASSAPALASSGVPAAPELLGATAGTEAGGLLGALGSAATPAALGITAGIWGSELADNALPILEGNAETDDFLDTALLTNPVTAWTVPLLDALGLNIKSGKDSDQRRRDAIRERLQSVDFVDDDFLLELPTPEGGLSTFDIGAEEFGDDGQATFDVDFGLGGIGETVGAANPLAAIVSGGDPKLTSDFSGMFTNAIQQSGLDPNTATREMYDRLGVDRNRAYNAVLNMGNIDNNTKEAYLAAIDKTFGIPNPTGGRAVLPE